MSSAINLFQDPITLPADPEWLITRTRASFPPVQIARRYIATYLDRVHKWYPFLSLDRLARDLENAHGSDEFARLTLFVIFAIAADKHDAYTSAEYFQTALSFVPPVVAQNSLDSIRALLLLTVHGIFTWNNDTVNLWYITGHATRVAVQLGITRNNPKWEFASSQQEDRRRVFWSLYALERHFASLTGRTTSIRREAIDAQLPQHLDETSPALANLLQQPVAMDLRPGMHLIKQRLLLGEVLECVYHAPSANSGLTVQDITTGIFHIQASLVEWAHHAMTIGDPYERQVLLLAFHQATLLLHRASPSFPSPPPDALDVCLGAARETIKICAEALANGTENSIFPGWQGFASVISAGLVLLYCSWSGPGCAQAISLTADPVIATSLAILDALAFNSPAPERYIRLYRRVIDAFSHMQRLPDVAIVAAALENSGLGGLDNLDLDAESLELLAQLLWA